MKIDQHNTEIYRNRDSWQKKPSLRKAYGAFYSLIASEVHPGISGLKLELGSGMGNIKEYIPDCITSDVFPNPWLDRVENVYQISFTDESIGHLVLFDVWHHLEHPANALSECWRVLVAGGRLILMEPAMSFFGKIIYGNCHHEPLGFDIKFSEQLVNPSCEGVNRYFAAQSSAHRIFVHGEFPGLLKGWALESIKQITSFAYWGTGGFSGPNQYPDFAYPAVCAVDRVLGVLPSLFAARLLVVLKKT